MVDRSEDGRAVRTLTAPPLELDIVEERLWVDGAPVHLGGKAFALLRTLMERPERLLTKDELIETVWEGRAVSDAVLTTAMKELRKALDDPARSPVFIETVHGRGYRFLPAVEALPEPRSDAALGRSLGRSGDGAAAPDAPDLCCPEAAQPRSSFLLWWAAAAAVLLVGAIAYSTMLHGERGADSADAVSRAGAEVSVVASHPKSIAVLPFLDLSPEGDHQWFVDGLTDEISSTLARTPDLRVLASAATAEDAEAPKVAYVLEGSVRRGADRVRVTARLVRVRNTQTVWSQTYDRANADMIGIQEDIAFKIAQAMRTVTDPDQLRQMVEIGTRSVEAYEALLAGHHFMNQQYRIGTDEFRRRAYEQYERARTLDPQFAEAHWLAARYWFERSTFIVPPDETVRISPSQMSQWFEERVSAAIAVASDKATVQLYRAALHEHRLQYRAAHDLLGAYVAQRPRDVYAWVLRSRVAIYVADYEAAREAARMLASIADKNSLYFTRTIPNLLWAQDFGGAERQARRSLELAPEQAFVQYHAHRALLWAGETEEAAAVLRLMEAGDLAERNKMLAALRQACAEGDLSRASALKDEISGLESTRVAIKWLIEMLMGRTEAAEAVLEPFDRPGYVHHLAGFMIYPHFDSRAFPFLSDNLAAENIERPAPLALPYACAPRVGVQ